MPYTPGHFLPATCGRVTFSRKVTGRGAQVYEWVDERDESGVSLREHYREEYYRVAQRLARLY